MTTNARWLKLIEDGQWDEAFDSLVGSTQEKLWPVALAMMVDHASAQDVLQECYMIAYEALRDGRWDGHHAPTWLRTVLVRLSLRRLKRARRWAAVKRLFMPEEVAKPMETTLSSTMVTHLDGLPLMQRIALVLYVFDEASNAQIARVLGKSEGAVEQLLHRARKTLKDRLSNEVDDE